MGFLRRLFGGQEKPPPDNPGDPDGVYFYVQCDHCQTAVRVRADRKHDFNQEGGQYSWHKVIVDSKCFRRMPTVVHLDSQFNVISAEIQGGRYISKAEYEAFLTG
ncbi:MAG: hypothetical protein KJ063_14590 [Anaerolineae bacterium]|nr:hypothetical protein [Anaerolineae bacterium]